MQPVRGGASKPLALEGRLGRNPVESPGSIRKGACVKKTTRVSAQQQARVVSSETLFQGRVFAIKREHTTEPGGIETTREIVAHKGSVVVLPVFPDGQILLIRQYRHAAAQFLWELVAGHREEGESFREAAPRELQEETGYSAKKFTKLLEIFPSPGLLSERMEIYLAEGLTQGAAKPEEDEKIDARVIPLAEAEKWIRTGKIKDAKSVAGILYYAQFAARHPGKRTR
jgi:nudix-type nucleoside diphosphatase (YffH/AdpP family)